MRSNCQISRMPLQQPLQTCRFPVWGLAGCCLLFLLTGCGKGEVGPEFAQAKGVVTYQGKPLKTGQVSFIPDGSKGTKGPMSSGAINEQGEFVLQTFKPADGAVVGFHQVVVTSYKASPFDPNNPSPPLESISLIPVKYGDQKTSELTAEVTADPEKNVYTFDLK